MKHLGKHPGEHPGEHPGAPAHAEATGPADPAPPAIQIRPQTPPDGPWVAALIGRAFAEDAHSQGDEALILERLGAAGALTVSLLAWRDGVLLGQAAASPVQVGGRSCGWYGLGPVAVEPSAQGQGLGTRLVRHCLDDLRRLGAAGCVVLGDPGWYGRFGFAARDGLIYPGPPPAYFMALRLQEGGALPQGEVSYHPAFGFQEP